MPLISLQLSAFISYSLANEYTVHSHPFRSGCELGSWGHTPPLPLPRSEDHLRSVCRIQWLPPLPRP